MKKETFARICIRLDRRIHPYGSEPSGVEDSIRWATKLIRYASLLPKAKDEKALEKILYKMETLSGDPWDYVDGKILGPFDLSQCLRSSESVEDLDQ